MATPVATNYAPESNTATNGNGLVGGGGGGEGSTSEPVNSLARQDSIYSVEMDDFHRALMEAGQPFGSMSHMDKLLAINLTMELENQALAASAIMEGATESGEGRRANDQGNVLIPSENGGGDAFITQTILVNELSCSSIPRTMSSKRVDEVWTENIKTNPSLPLTGSGSPRSPDAQYLSEDFVYGVEAFKQGQHSLFSKHFVDGVEAFKQGQPGQAQAYAHHQARQQQQASEHWLQVQQQQAQAQQAHHQAHLLQQQQALEAQQSHHHAQLLQAQAYAANGMHNRASNGGPIPNMNSNVGYTGMASTSAPQLGQMGMQFVQALPAQSPASVAGVNDHGNGLSLSPVGTYSVDGSKGGRTRGANHSERVERRQMRARKNRESAGKSRARKQAHDAELEAQAIQLKEENERLKKEMKEIQDYQAYAQAYYQAYAGIPVILRRLPKPKGQTVGSFQKGLITLPNAIAASLEDKVKTNWKLEAIQKSSSGDYTLTYETPQGTRQVSTKLVVLTVPAYVASELLSEISPSAARSLEQSIILPLQQLQFHITIKEERLVDGELNGFGQLHPRSQGIQTLGTIYSSALFPERAPEERVLLLNYIGGAQYPQIATMGEEAIVDIVDKDVHKMLVRPEAPPPVLLGVRVWPRAIPACET